jgi:hypothetical protein
MITGFRPTDVSVVLAYLAALDDFANKAMILEATKILDNRLRPALAHLMKHHAVGCVIVNANELWFYATPGDDDRKKIRSKTANDLHRNDKGRRFNGRSKILSPSK